VLKEGWGRIWFRSEGWVGFQLKFLVYLTAFVIGGMIAIAENTSDVTRFFCTGTERSLMRAGAFDASGLLMAKVFSVTVALAVCALRDVSFGIGGFKCDFTLLKEFYLEDVFVVGGRF
jgi:hypothetical protein